MIVISKNKFFDKLVGVVNKYNNTYHRKISMKPVGINGGIYSCFDFDIKTINKDPKFKVLGHVRVSNFKKF